MEPTHAHWETIHATKDEDAVSWYQPTGDLWIDLIDDLGLDPQQPIVDVGSGSSRLVEALLERGYEDLTAVDVSESALARIRNRLGPDAHRVCLSVCDVRQYRARRPVALWHDRAVFHFLTEEADRSAYRQAMRSALRPGSRVVVATFAPDGPRTCSALPVIGYDAPSLAAALGFTSDDLLRAERRIHVTPWGREQPFTVVVLAVHGSDALGAGG